MNEALGRRIKPTVWIDVCANYEQCGNSIVEKYNEESGPQKEYCASCMRQRNNDQHRAHNRNYKRRLLLAKRGQQPV